jgi:hypothetical protein
MGARICSHVPTRGQSGEADGAGAVLSRIVSVCTMIIWKADGRSIHIFLMSWIFQIRIAWGIWMIRDLEMYTSKLAVPVTCFWINRLSPADEVDDEFKFINTTSRGVINSQNTSHTSLFETVKVKYVLVKCFHGLTYVSSKVDILFGLIRVILTFVSSAAFWIPRWRRACFLFRRSPCILTQLKKHHKYVLLFFYMLCKLSVTIVLWGSRRWRRFPSFMFILSLIRLQLIVWGRQTFI